MKFNYGALPCIVYVILCIVVPSYWLGVVTAIFGVWAYRDIKNDSKY